MPCVSVITCTYNRAHLIGDTIRSVLNQSFRDFEYIVIDDGSTDNTEEVIRSFNQAQIKYFKYERTCGHLSRLRNFAHQHCAGEYIAYIDSDDLWNERKLELQINELNKNPRLGFSFTDIEIFNQHGTLRSTIYAKNGIYIGSVFPAMLRNELIICHTTLVVKKTCLEKTGPMDEQLHSGDHDFVFMLSRYFDACVIYEPLVRVRKHDQNSTASHSLSLRLLREHHQTLNKLFVRMLISKREYRAAMATTSYSFGVQVLPAHDYDTAIRYFLTCLSIAPLNIKAWLRLFITLSKKIIGH